jgi:hypothetical protein
MVDMSEAFPVRFLKAADLEGGELRFRIQKIAKEMVGAKMGYVMYFWDEERVLNINKTNNNTLIKLFGPDSKDWINQEIMLTTQHVEFKGDVVPAIRVRGVPGGSTQPSRQPTQVARPSLKDDMNDEVPF